MRKFDEFTNHTLQAIARTYANAEKNPQNAWTTLTDIVVSYCEIARPLSSALQLVVWNEVERSYTFLPN